MGFVIVKRMEHDDRSALAVQGGDVATWNKYLVDKVFAFQKGTAIIGLNESSSDPADHGDMVAVMGPVASGGKKWIGFRRQRGRLIGGGPVRSLDQAGSQILCDLRWVAFVRP